MYRTKNTNWGPQIDKYLRHFSPPDLFAVAEMLVSLKGIYFPLLMQKCF